jgi:hypothetical protein
VFEPQVAIAKPATDVVLHGHACAIGSGTTESLVGIRIGPVQKMAKVFGDRWLVRRPGFSSITKPAPFERIPIVYEFAFGGTDKRSSDSERHRAEPRNPVGLGFRATPDADEVQLPNFEDPQCLIRSLADAPAPAGFGFVAPHWQPRLAYAGTYDAAWNRSRRPLLPKDFDRRFFNAASLGLVAPGHLRGDEPVLVIGTTPQGRVEFRLPGVPPPACVVELRGRKRVGLQTVLDTVIVDTDARTVTLTWRANISVRNGPHDVASMELLPFAPEDAVRIR